MEESLDCFSEFDNLRRRAEETHSIVVEYITLYNKYWEEQQNFNNRLYSKIENVEKLLIGITGMV